MATRVFSVVLDRVPNDQEIDALYAAGCDDAAFSVDHGLSIGEFDRVAPTLADAIASAVRSIESTGLVALRILDGDLVTLADIGERVGQSRESIRRYATGERGPGGFPPPVNPTRDGTVFYRWSEVAPWMRECLGLDVPDDDAALVVANLILQARRHRPGSITSKRSAGCRPADPARTAPRRSMGGEQEGGAEGGDEGT